MVASVSSLFSSSPTGYLQLSGGYTAEYFIRGEGEPLVLVPGLAGGSGLLRPLVEQLAKEHQVITYELRGETSHLLDRTYGFDQLVQDLGDVIDGLRLECPGLMGVSFGGAIALAHATCQPHRLNFLALQGTSPCHAPGLFEGVAEKVLSRMLLPEDNPFINQFFRLLTGGKSATEESFHFVVEQCWRTDQSVMAHRFSLLDGFDVSDRLENLRVPSLVLAGDRDALVRTSEMNGFATLAPNADIRTINGAGHFAFVTHPDAIAEELRDFQRGVLATI